MRFVRDMKEGMHISSIYLCKNKQILQTKNGKDYISVILSDKTGSIDGKIWEVSSPGIREFELLDYVEIEADVTSYNNNLQLNIRSIRVAGEGEYIKSDYMPTSRFDNDEMYANLLELVKSVKQEQLSGLLKAFFVEDKDFIASFRSGSAAKSVHHSFVGGLLEHTLSVANMCEYIAKHYPVVNHDLLITGALLHDIGKVREISAMPQNDYTDEGQLIGHIVIGIEMIDEKSDIVKEMPPLLYNELRHMILAHHGEFEFGSPKKPALIEAMALNLADNADAKLEIMTELAAKAGSSTDWQGFNRFLDSNYRRTVV